jgi:DNA-binding response OmpR family regulator
MSNDNPGFLDRCAECLMVGADVNERRLKVLFADDDSDTLELLGMAAKRIGNFDYRLASDGSEVEHLLQNESFDVLCLDAEMPVAYGTTIARVVRTQDINIPIIFFTGRSGREVRLAIQEVKAEYVSKPADPVELMTLIKRLGNERNPYHGPERRKLSVNTTNYNRRRTDKPFSLPEPLKIVAREAKVS